MYVESKLLFPRQVVTAFDPELDLEDLISACYESKLVDSGGRVVANESGWQSDSIERGNVLFDSLTLKLQKLLYVAMREGMGIHQDSRVSFGNFWINIAQPGAYMRTHIHPMSVYSGVVYLKTPVNSGRIFFEDDQHRTLELYSRTPKAVEATLQYHSYFFDPKPGTLLLFPATLPHFVEKNKSEEDRVTIAFNLI